jgi:hypothetical protein
MHLGPKRTDQNGFDRGVAVSFTGMRVARGVALDEGYGVTRMETRHVCGKE